MTEVRKGIAAILEAAERKGSGEDFHPFCPEIRWKDKEEKNILILTDLDELQEYSIHEWIKVGTQTNKAGELKDKYEWFISRKDPSIGETYDELQDRLGQKPTMRFMGVAVELVPVVEQGRGGKSKVIGFEVATTTYEAKGEDDEMVDVDQPEIGIISLSSQNFWGWLAGFQAKHENVNLVPFAVTRRGADANTAYDFVHMMGMPVDLSGLLDTIEGCSYLRESEDFDEIIADAVEAADSAPEGEDPGLAAAMVIADALLAKRVEELSDAERYRTLVGPIEELPPKWGKGKKGAKKGASEKASRSKSSRVSSREKTPDTDGDDDSSQEASEAPATDQGFSKLRDRVRNKTTAAAAE